MAMVPSSWKESYIDAYDLKNILISKLKNEIKKAEENNSSQDFINGLKLALTLIEQEKI